MTSRTKVAVSRPVLERVVREIGGVDDAVTSVRELTDGMFNAAHAMGRRERGPQVRRAGLDR